MDHNLRTNVVGARARSLQTRQYPSCRRKRKKSEFRPQKHRKTCTRKHTKACARALATLSSPANLGDLALGAAALGAPAYAVEDVVEGTCALPPPEGERKGKGVRLHPFALVRSTRLQHSLSTTVPAAPSSAAAAAAVVARCCRRLRRRASKHCPAQASTATTCIDCRAQHSHVKS